MKLKVFCSVDSKIPIDGEIVVPYNEKEYIFTPNTDGILSEISIIAKIATPEKFYSETTYYPKGNIKANIKINFDTELYDSIVREFHEVESLMAIIWNIKKINWDTAAYDLIFENEEERRKAQIFGFSTRTEYADLETPMDETAFRDLISRKESLSSLVVCASFYREGRNEYRSKRYINAFYNYYYVLEGLYGNGKTKNYDVEMQFKNSLRLRELTETILNDHIHPHPGVPHCYYLITVSENAMHTFERRGLPFRDVFDSSFDEILYIEPMRLKTAEELLARRVVGKPYVFICLNYCLSGGLPRDFIRTFRELHALVKRDKIKDDLSTLCATFIAADLKAKVRATNFTAANNRSRASIVNFITELCRLEDSEINPKTLLTETENIFKLSNNISNDELELSIMSKEFAVYLLFLVTILEFFTNTLEEQKIKEVELDGNFERLARARQLIAIDHETSVALINNFRWENNMLIFEIKNK